MTHGVGILLVDDDEQILKMCSFYFTHCGYRCFRALDAFEAKRILASEQGINVVLSDYNMPGNENLEFIYFIRDNYPDVRTIMWSGQSLNDIPALCDRLGLYGCFQKPVKMSLLSETIRQATKVSVGN